MRGDNYREEMREASPVQSNILFKFCGVYSQFWNPHLSVICGYLKIYFNHRDIKFEYIYRFAITDHSVIDKLIFS